MRYVETVARSAELLRQAIPLMSQQAAALHPVSYAVWYEYVAKSNPPLLKMVDDSLTRFGRLDEAKTHAIFRQYISEPLVRLPERVADGFERLLSDISDSANRAGAQTERYSHALEHLRGSLPVAAGGPVAEVLEHTAAMAKAVDHLRAELAASQREIRDLRAEVHRVRNDSLVDALTGLANRRSFDERLATLLLDASISSSASSPLCLALVDIDHFKRINDTYGHTFGDEVLKAVARSLSGVVGDDGVVARIGGEEFAILRYHRPRNWLSARGPPSRRAESAAPTVPHWNILRSRWALPGRFRISLRHPSWRVRMRLSIARSKRGVTASLSQSLGHSSDSAAWTSAGSVPSLEARPMGDSSKMQVLVSSRLQTATELVPDADSLDIARRSSKHDRWSRLPRCDARRGSHTKRVRHCSLRAHSCPCNASHRVANASIVLDG